jgi:uncharacterized protein YjbI with pentapeptide repeats
VLSSRHALVLWCPAHSYAGSARRLSQEGSAIKKRLLAICAGLGLLLGAGLALTAGLSGADPDRSDRRAKRSDGGRAARSKAVQVELALTAREARWTPGVRRGRGRLTLDRVSPRMLMMASAPRRELAVVPAGLLAGNWNRLFRRHHGTANMVLSIPVAGAPRLFALRVELLARRRAGERMTFRVLPLKRTAHRALAMGRSPHVWEDATLYVDPTITDAVKALWQSLLAYFLGERLAVPDNPTTRTGNTTTYGNRGVYQGPDTADVSSDAAWQRVEEQILNSTGAWIGDLTQAAPSLVFRLGSYEGQALFNHDFTRISFEPIQSGAEQVRNLAIFDSRVETLSFNRSEVGGANLRALDARTFTVTNSAFDTVDLTGSSIGDEPAETRSTVQNAAFVNVETARRVTDPSGNEDAATRRFEAGQTIVFNNTDFTWVTFQNVDFKGAAAFSTTFQACGLQEVDFKAAQISGRSPTTRDDRFEPTFDNSIMEGVVFDGATLANVSFRGVDFSGGGNTFNGATLENVDFTGATGLQSIDWRSVTVKGNVYGLAEYAEVVRLEDPAYVRYLTFDGVVPEIDPDTGWDIEPETGYLIEPRSGVRFAPGTDPPAPIDPNGNPLRDPQTGVDLVFERDSGRLINPDTGREFRVDYETGWLEDV